MSLDIDSTTEKTPTTDTDEGLFEKVIDADLDEVPDVENRVADDTEGAAATARSRPWLLRFRWNRAIAYGLLPGLALLLTLGVGYLKWQGDSARQAKDAAAQSVQAATESTIAMLAYQPDTVDQQLTAATDRLTGSFRDDYTKLINDIVIPGSKAKRIGALATVPAAASVAATENHAVVLVFVNQTTTIGDGTPTSSLSSVRVTLDKVGNRWLVSQFEPV